MDVTDMLDNAFKKAEREKDIKRLARIDRGQAVNLARNLLTNHETYAKITPKGIYMLADAILRMDEALSKISKNK